MRLLFIAILCFHFLIAKCSDTAHIRLAEDSIKIWFNKITPGNYSKSYDLINDSIQETLKRIIIKPSSFKYPFDSLNKIGKIFSPDSLFRIISWNIPLNYGKHKYFAFIIYNDTAKKIYTLTELSDHPDDSLIYKDSIFTPLRWYGALYYDIIQTSYLNITYYTLLGFDFNNLFTSRKIIDMIRYDNSGIPTFGYPVFVIKNKTKKRLVFEYSARIVMSLKYNSKKQMIVFDHLSPSAQNYESNYEFYGPDFSFDGLTFKNGRWLFVEDVDARTGHK